VAAQTLLTLIAKTVLSNIIIVPFALKHYINLSKEKEWVQIKKSEATVPSARVGVQPSPS
jgi:hypothetical protein